MSDAKFTPGPWAVAQHEEGFGVARVTPEGNYWIADMIPQPKDHREELGNALLIAAAPKMLQALHEFEDAFVEFDPENKASRTRMRLALVSARDAMAEATGVAA